ncbi:hypothetical protein OAA09_00535 [bacterium]|nr:hypothetical protein [bacterium]
MEFLSERIVRLAGLVTEGLAEEAVETHQPYQTNDTIESSFQREEDEKAPDADHNKINVDYALAEASTALVESRLRDAIRMELKAILEESDDNDDNDLKYGATGFKAHKPAKRSVHMGGIGVGFKNWQQN